MVITARKAINQFERQNALKRGGGKLIGEAMLVGANRDDALGGLEQVVGTEPSPEFAIMIADEYRRLLHSLGDETLQQIALWKMEGHTNEEIAQQLGCALRTVANKLNLIRMKWERQVP